MGDDSIDMEDDSIDMGDHSIDMGYLVTLNPGECLGESEPYRRGTAWECQRRAR